MAKQAGEISKSLDELEKRFRTPPDTRGIIYIADKVTSRIGQAYYYLVSSPAAPTQPAQVSMEKARLSLAAATEAVDAFMAGELASFGEAVNAAGIGLLR